MLEAEISLANTMSVLISLFQNSEANEAMLTNRSFTRKTYFRWSPSAPILFYPLDLSSFCSKKDLQINIYTFHFSTSALTVSKTISSFFWKSQCRSETIAYICFRYSRTALRFTSILSLALVSVNIQKFGLPFLGSCQTQVDTGNFVLV